MSGHHHHHGHAHGHDAGHRHDHAPTDFGRAFAIGAALNLGFVAVEFGYGLASGSVALLADAGHNLSDVLGLLIAWGAATLASRPASKRFTYGLGSSSILAALANAGLLFLATGAIAWEAVRRLGNPPVIDAVPVIWVAAAGIAVNGITAWLFMRGRNDDLNIRGAFLHMLADAIVSAGVVIAGIAMLTTGATWIDPVVSLVVVAVILWSSWGLFRDALGMALQAVPPGVDADAVEAMLANLPGVEQIHDLHIWPMSTTRSAMTVHLVMPAGHPGDAFLVDVAERLSHEHHITHATMQVELGAANECHVAGH